MYSLQRNPVLNLRVSGVHIVAQGLSFMVYECLVVLSVYMSMLFIIVLSVLLSEKFLLLACLGNLEEMFTPCLSADKARTMLINIRLAIFISRSFYPIKLCACVSWYVF